MYEYKPDIPAIDRWPLDGTEALTLATRIYKGRIRKDITRDDRWWAKFVILAYTERTGTADGWHESDEFARYITMKIDFFTRIARNPEAATAWAAHLPTSRKAA